MNLKSLDGILQGVSKLQAASVVAWAANAAAMLSFHIPNSTRDAGIAGVTVLLAAVHVADGYIRGNHARALPALIAQGAEQVAKVQDPRVDAVAQSVETVANRVAELENRPVAPSLPEIIAGLVGKDAPADPAVPVDPVSTPSPANPGA